MKKALLINLFLILIQSSIIPVNITYIFILAYSYFSMKSSDYILAFISGLILSLLSSQNLGTYPIIFILAVFLIHLSRKIPVSAHLIIFIIFSSAILFSTSQFLALLSRHSVVYIYLLIEIILSLITYFILHFFKFKHSSKQTNKLSF